MKIRKRFAVIGGTIVVIMVLAGCAPHFGPFGGGFHRCRDFGAEMPGFVLKQLDSKIKELNLAPVQKTKYDEFRAQVKEQMLAAKEDRLKFREIVRSELAKNAPDVAVLNGMMKKKIEIVSAALQNDLDLLTSFYSTLDEGQKQKVAAEIRKRMAKMDACREGGQ